MGIQLSGLRLRKIGASRELYLLSGQHRVEYSWLDAAVEQVNSLLSLADKIGWDIESEHNKLAADLEQAWKEVETAESALCWKTHNFHVLEDKIKKLEDELAALKEKHG